jgi:uncharacterized membrane protein YqhA
MTFALLVLGIVLLSLGINNNDITDATLFWTGIVAFVSSALYAAYSQRTSNKKETGE